MSKILYEDENGKISGRQDFITGNVILKVEYKRLNSESITVPEKSLESIVFFLNKARGL